MLYIFLVNYLSFWFSQNRVFSIFVNNSFSNFLCFLFVIYLIITFSVIILLRRICSDYFLLLLVLYHYTTHPLWIFVLYIDFYLTQKYKRKNAYNLYILFWKNMRNYPLFFYYCKNIILYYPITLKQIKKIQLFYTTIIKK